MDGVAARNDRRGVKQINWILIGNLINFVDNSRAILLEHVIVKKDGVDGGHFCAASSDVRCRRGRG